MFEDDNVITLPNGSQISGDKLNIIFVDCETKQEFIDRDDGVKGYEDFIELLFN